MKTNFFLFIFLLHLGVCAQETLWVDRVIEVSTEKEHKLGGVGYRALQVVGKPNVYPQGTNSACSWEPTGLKSDYIRVRFQKAIVPKIVGIAENLNPGAISKIYGYTPIGDELLLYENNENPPDQKVRLWVLPVESWGQKIRDLKIVIDHSKVNGIKQYDAIAISNDTLITAGINLVEDIPEDLILERLNESINSRFNEVAPVITQDGKTLYFTRGGHPENIKNSNHRPPKQDIWYSQQTSNGYWSEAINIKRPLNNRDDNALVGVSNNGRTLYLLNEYNGNRESMSNGISKSTLKKKSKWNKPEALKINDFEARPTFYKSTKRLVTYSEFSLSQDKATIVMAIKTEKSIGDRDLFVSFKNPDGSYSSPKNLGPTLNTAEVEGAPFLSFDTKMLFFNSRGHPGYGDADIFVSHRLDDTWTHWSEPQNLGPKINSSKWDGFISIPAAGDIGFLSSHYEEDSKADIFKFNLFPSIQPLPYVLVNFTVKDNTDKRNKIKAIPYIVSSDKNKDMSNLAIMTSTNGEKSSVFLPTGAKYNLLFSKDGYSNTSLKLDLSDREATNERNIEILMKPLKKDKNI